MFFVIIKFRNNRFRVFNCQRTKTMRYSSLLALCAFMLCLNAPEVRGEILAVHTYDVMTHTALLPKPVASDNTFSLAATWWLPDWQGSQGSRGSNDIGGGDIVKDDSDCMKHYNLYATCPSPKLSTGVVHPVAGMTCQKSCYCPSEYKYTSSNCSGEYEVSGTSCEGKYNQCVCKSEFRYNSSNCSGEYQVSGTSCGGKYNGCTIRPECTVSSKDCTYGCAGYNSCNRCTSCKSNPDCDVSSKSCGSLGCASYNSCSKCTSCNTDPCSGVSCGSNAYCSGGSCYCNSGYKKCSGSCISNSSCCGGCSSNQTCQNGSCVTNTPSCSDTCPSYTVSSSSSCTYGATSCYDTCYGKTWYKCNDAPAAAPSAPSASVNTCTYTTTASSCSSQCKNVGSSSCTKNGTTYYNGCGSSKCSSGQTCKNGTCVSSCTPSCTNESNCSWGSKNISNGCGGTCVKCYPSCTGGYIYNFSSADCDIRPAKYLWQSTNPNCGKCVCDNFNSNCGGKPCQCAYI